MQLYCPSDENSIAYHRVIYVFCCQKPQCASPITVLRSQLEIENQCYNEDGSRKNFELREDILVGTKKLDSIVGFCSVCACDASMVCSICQERRYCTKEHQKQDWPAHKKYCNSNNEPIRTEYGLKEFELISEQEPLPISDDTFQMQVGEAEEGDADLEKEEETVTGVDKQFLKFQKRIALAPDQVLRYYHIDNDTSNEGPLWVAEEQDQIIPNCDCGAPRKFEFQIMPQLLNYIGDNIDWGTILVYTCTSDCSRANGSYSLEYGRIQHFTNQGMSPAIAPNNSEPEVIIK